jgi:imidazolonepropionase-like amidohydrolase
MNGKFMVRGKRIVTVSQLGTIENGALVIEDGKIMDIGTWDRLQKQYPAIRIIDCSNFVITPSLVDCHTHLLEFAPTSLYPDAPINHFVAGKELLFGALSSGITALGEQICGHPQCDFSVNDYRNAIKDMPIDISFATTSISIGFDELTHFSALTQSKSIDRKTLNDLSLVRLIAQASDYPGENIFINATPANFTANEVPRAGEIIYTLEELKQIVHIYHQSGKQIGTHVAGAEAIDLALQAGFDVLHHAHGITDALIEKASKQKVKVVATPIGGTHLMPNSPEDILKLMDNKMHVSISTDAYLPPFQGASWLPFEDNELKGPNVLMLIAQPAMQLLKKHHHNDNEILALLTANPAEILGKENQFGKLEVGMEANFLVAEGIPGLEITDIEKIKKVFYKGRQVVNRL